MLLVLEGDGPTIYGGDGEVPRLWRTRNRLGGPNSGYGSRGTGEELITDGESQPVKMDTFGNEKS